MNISAESKKRERLVVVVFNCESSFMVFLPEPIHPRACRIFGCNCALRKGRALRRERRRVGLASAP